jgi:hypothetical protein
MFLEDENVPLVLGGLYNIDAASTTAFKNGKV